MGGASNSKCCKGRKIKGQGKGMEASGGNSLTGGRGPELSVLCALGLRSCNLSRRGTSLWKGSLFIRNLCGRWQLSLLTGCCRDWELHHLSLVTVSSRVYRDMKSIHSCTSFNTIGCNTCCLIVKSLPSVLEFLI